MMFERFTEDARQVVVDAQTQAQRLQHDFIGCEHILLALSTRDDPVGETLRAGGVTTDKIDEVLLREFGKRRDPFDKLDKAALATVGIDVDKVKDAVQSSFGPGGLELIRIYGGRPRTRRFPPRRRKQCNHRPFTKRAKDCLSSALKQAVTAHDNYIGTQHIAQATLTMKHSSVPVILAALGASPDALATDINNKYRKAS